MELRGVQQKKVDNHMQPPHSINELLASTIHNQAVIPPITVRGCAEGDHVANVSSPHVLRGIRLRFFAYCNLTRHDERWMHSPFPPQCQ
jgi:hypothetical protein